METDPANPRRPRGSQIRSGRVWIFGRISDQPANPAEREFLAGSQIRPIRLSVGFWQDQRSARSLKLRRPSVGFRPDLVRDPVRPADERGERESADLLKGEKEGDSTIFLFYFFKSQRGSATSLSMSIWNILFGKYFGVYSISLF